MLKPALVISDARDCFSDLHKNIKNNNNNKIQTYTTLGVTSGSTGDLVSPLSTPSSVSPNCDTEMSPQSTLSYSLFPFRANIPFLGYVVDPDQSRLPRPGCQTCLAWLLTLISQTNSDSLIMWSRNLAHTLCYSVCFMLLLLFKSYAPEFKLYVFARRKSKNVVITVSKYCKALLSLFYSLCIVIYF